MYPTQKSTNLKRMRIVTTFLGIRFHDNSIQVRYESAQSCTTIDPLTAEHIELITSIGDNKSKYSLLGVLNKCTTRGS